MYRGRYMGRDVAVKTMVAMVEDSASHDGACIRFRVRVKNLAVLEGPQDAAHTGLGPCAWLAGCKEGLAWLGGAAQG